MNLRTSVIGLWVVGAIVTSVFTVGATGAAAAPPAAAPDSFDPGLLVSDANFFDPQAMSVADVQRFLDSQVRTCSLKAQQPCLKDWLGDVDAQPATEQRCLTALPAKKDQTAAEVIVAVALACSVSPRVLLVTLQKEQGLVTKKSPKKSDYNAATGYACPDTASGCDPTYRGFANQVYWAARAFRAYAVNYNEQFPQYQPGLHDILYQSKLVDTGDNCGTLAVDVQNIATTALYTYTPYTPNAASLANPFATGDNCSSYGNRNFWGYYNEWFGDPTAGNHVLSSDGRVYLTVDGTRWELPLGSANLAASLAPLGRTAAVSAEYLGTLDPVGELGPILQDAVGQYSLLAGGKRYELDGCGAVGALGFSCASATLLPTDVMQRLPVDTTLIGADSVVVRTSRTQLFVLGDGVRREVADLSLVDSAARATALPVDSAVLSGVPYGAPLVAPGTVAAVRGSLATAVIGDNVSYSIADDAPRVRAWWTAPTAQLDGASVDRLPGVTRLTEFVPGLSCGEQDYLVVSGELRSVSAADAAAYGPAFGFRELDPATCTELAPRGEIGTLVSYDSRYYLVADGALEELTTKQYTLAAKDSPAAVAISHYYLTLLSGGHR